jgi:uncharacterized RDD family membrane protein YckC
VEKTARTEIRIAGHRLARLGDRLLAVVLDMAVIMAIFAVIGMWTAVKWGGLSESGFSVEGIAAWVTIGLTMVFALLYYWLLEGVFGATLGKGMVGIQVRGAAGGTCGLGPSLVRNLLRIVDALFLYLVGFLVAIFSRLRQRVGDHLARTVVVEKNPGILFRGLVVIIWLGILIGGIWQAYQIHKNALATSARGKTAVGTGTSGQSQSPGVGSSAVDSKASGGGTIMTSGDLKIVQFEFLEGKEGPPRTTSLYKPGDKLFSRYKIAGYTTDDQENVKLQLQVAVTDPNNLSLFEWKGEMNQKISKDEPAEGWCNLTLVKFVPPGSYMLRIRAHDMVKNTNTESVAQFQVDAPPPVVATRLELRDLQLSLSEDGPPLNPPEVKPEETVYMAAKLAGMQFKEEQINVGIAFQLIGPRGDILLDRPEFLDIRDSFDYHPPGFFIPISAHVSLPSPAAKGVYTEKYVLTDRNANATETYAMKFTVK